MECKICKQKFKNNHILSIHVFAKHTLNSKDYYDRFLLEPNQNKCNVCGKETAYRGINIGYLKNCSIKCRSNNKNIKHDYWKDKKQDKSTIEKRIKNTNQDAKEYNRKSTMLLKYGVDNPAKLKEVTDKISKKLTGRKIPRTKEWQKNIIISKKKNGTIKHTSITKNKISASLNDFFSKNFDREKYITNYNKNHLSGWYKDIFFRSSLELSFLHNNKDKKYRSCENKEYAVEYYFNNKTKIYYPDYTDDYYIYEIKPSSLLKNENNKLKIEAGRCKYGDKFILITEKECKYISKEEIKLLIENGIVVLPETSKDILLKYRHR